MTVAASSVSHLGTVAMRPDVRDLVRQRLVIYDGGMGTMLFAAGLVGRESPQPWNLGKPDLGREAYRPHYPARARVVHATHVCRTPHQHLESDPVGGAHDVHDL